MSVENRINTFRNAGNFGKAEMDSLKTMDKNKAFSLDKDGKLTTVDLNKKPDGKAMRFMKGIFKKGYDKADRADLRRMQKTATNPRFLNALDTKITYGAVALMKNGEMTQPTQMKLNLMTGRMFKTEKPVTPDMVNKSLAFAKTTESRLDECLADPHNNITDSKGESMSIVGFIEKHCQHYSQDTKRTVNGAISQTMVNVLGSFNQTGMGSPNQKAGGTAVSQMCGQLMYNAFANEMAESFGDGDMKTAVKGAIDQSLQKLKGLAEEMKDQGKTDTEIADRLQRYCQLPYREGVEHSIGRAETWDASGTSKKKGIEEIQ